MLGRTSDERREARGRAPRKVMCAAAARRESDAMRKETRGERYARGEKNERREVGCREEEKAVRPEQAREELCATAVRREKERVGNGRVNNRLHPPPTNESEINVRIH